MTEHVYRITEVVGSSDVSISEAVKSAVSRVSQTVRNVEWFEVGQIRGHVADGKVGHFQVTVRAGFRVD